MRSLLLGIDVGTTGTKSLLLDGTGQIVSEAYRSYNLNRPRPLHVEQDANHWWQAVTETVRECLLNVDASDVVALSISAQGGALVAVDEVGIPLAPARSWLDRRAVAEEEELEQIFTRRGIYDRTGWRLYSAYNCVQLLNMKHTQPELFSQARYFFGTADYIYFKLTGLAVIDRNSAGITQLMDVHTQNWDVEILRAIGVDSYNLPILISSGSSIGMVSEEAATQLGLPTTVQVIAGGHDQYCAALGAGVISGGDLLISTGTAWVVLGITDELLPDVRTNFGVGSHVVATKFGAFGSFRNGGVCLDWIRGVLGDRGEPLSYSELEASVQEIPAGTEGLLFFPHFDGTTTPTWSDQSAGSFIGLELRHGSEHLIRAVMEGVCFELRTVFDTFAESYPTVVRIRVLGGAAKSPTWTQMMADVLGQEIEVPEVVHSACIGAAILAGVGSGLFADAGRGFDAMNIAIHKWKPGNNSHTYAHTYKKYQAYSHALKNAYESIESDAFHV
jgi:sugar (pentulose or hexulose) kinase